MITPSFFAFEALNPEAPFQAVAYIVLPGPVVKGKQTAARTFPVRFEADTPEAALVKARAHWAAEEAKDAAKMERARALVARSAARAAITKALPTNTTEEA